MAVGRPTELDDLKAQKIYEELRKGASRAAAAGMVGVQPSTLYEWLAKGRRGDPRYAEFAEKVVKADSEARAKMERAIYDAATDTDRPSWQAAQAWLQARAKQMWGKPVDKKNDRPDEEVSDEEILKVLAGDPRTVKLLEKARKAG